MDLLASKAGPLICLYCVVFQLYNVTNGDRPCAMNMCLWEHHVQRVKVTLLTQTFCISFSHELLTQRGDGLASQPWFNMENVMLMYFPIIIMWRSSSPHCPHTHRVVYEGHQIEYDADGVATDKDVIYYFRVAAVNAVGIAIQCLSQLYQEESLWALQCFLVHYNWQRKRARLAEPT